MASYCKRHFLNTPNFTGGLTKEAYANLVSLKKTFLFKILINFKLANIRGHPSKLYKKVFVFLKLDKIMINSSSILKLNMRNYYISALYYLIFTFLN